MALDPNIALGVKGVEVASPVALYAQSAQLQNMQTQNQLHQMQMREAEATSQERNALRQLNPMSPDYEAQLFRLNPQLGISYRKESTAAEASRAAAAASRTTGPIRPSLLIREMQEHVARIESQPARVLPALPAATRGKITWDAYSASYMLKRAIGSKRYEAECKDNCAICLDKHTNGDSILTVCRHSFGKQCWEDWMSNPAGNQKCPTCREECPSVLTYTLRAERRPRANAIVEVDLTEN
jgi:hypothetical protein